MSFDAGKKTMELHVGTRFVHKNFIADGTKLHDVRADPENPDYYAIFEITAIRGGRVYYRRTGTERRTGWYFDRIAAADHIRKVL